MAHVRSLIDCGVRAAYPPATVPDALGSLQLRVVPLSEVEDPGLLLFCCADLGARFRLDREGSGDGSDDDDRRSVRSARTSRVGQFRCVGVVNGQWACGSVCGQFGSGVTHA